MTRASHAFLLLVLAALAGLLALVLFTASFPSQAQQPQLPEQVSVLVVHTRPSGARVRLPGTTAKVWPCGYFEDLEPPPGVPKNCGCWLEAVHPGNPGEWDWAAYPITTTPNPITLTLESEYLPNVVVWEEARSAAFLPTALWAQAVAARSYAVYMYEGGPYTFSHEGVTLSYDLNSSAGFQVYWPGLDMPTSWWNRAEQAVESTQHQYMTHPSEPRTAIFAKFHADSGTWTLAGGKPYLKAVFDPISGEEGTLVGHGHGMPQKAANRWARGNTGYLSDGNPWVQWKDHRQILVHYYTGIHITSTQGILTPPDRWNALNITPTAPLTLTAGLSYPFTLTVQDSGVTTWTVGGGFALGYRWRRAEGREVEEEEGTEAVPLPQTVLPGQALTLTVPVRPLAGANGAYTLMWDIRHGSQWFSRQTPAWPTQDMLVWIIPLLTDVYDDPDPFSPNNDGWQDKTFIHYTLHQTATVRLVIYTIDECYLNRILWSGQQPSGEQFVAWDGCLPRNPNPPGHCPTRLLTACREGWGVPMDGTYPYYLYAGLQVVTGTVMIDTGPNVWRSEDGGDTWTPITAGLPAHFVVRALVTGPTLSEADLLFVGGSTCSGGEPYRLYRSVDRGETWQDLSGGLPEYGGEKINLTALLMP